jgi:hypothetical protein
MSPFTELQFAQNTPIAAVVNGATINLYGVGQDGQVYTAWLETNQPSWQGWGPILKGTFAQNTPIAAVVNGRTINLFAVGGDGQVWWNWLDTNQPSWQGWGPIPTGTFSQKTPIAAVVNGATINLYGVGQDGQVWWNLKNPNQPWQTWAPLASAPLPQNSLFAQNTLIAAVVTGGTIKLHGVGSDDQVYTLWLIPNETNRDWTPIGGPFTANTPIAAVANGGAINLYGVGQDGQVYTSWPIIEWFVSSANGQTWETQSWETWFPIGSQPPDNIPPLSS